MPVVVTGSIANDHLMTFPGRFADQLIPDQLHRLSLSFLVEDLDIRRGGVAANICYGMAQLGLRPVLVGAVGNDFGDYRSWLERHGVDTTSVHVSDLRHTSRFLATTDSEQCQIASFYAGAMVEARDIELAPVAERVGPVELVVVSPNDPEAMLRHTRECRATGIAFVADPSQQLSSLEQPQIRELLDGAAYLFSNDYERALIESKSGWSADDVLARVGVRVTTLGPKGCVVEQRGEAAIEVPVVPEERRADPTGVGDAFRAGFLAARSWQLSLERSAQVGTLLATYVLETVGTQEYELQPSSFLARLAAVYGEDAAADVAPNLTG
ncbi:MAG: carbohydrate kinase family protein [Mycobacteriales bacterium]|nr:carbohydrate kinase family protein [Frankia sp.]